MLKNKPVAGNVCFHGAEDELSEVDILTFCLYGVDE